MTTLAQLRSNRDDAERQFQLAMVDLGLPGSTAAWPAPELLAKARGYHREVCAAYAAELSLIANGTLPIHEPTKQPHLQ